MYAQHSDIYATDMITREVTAVNTIALCFILQTGRLMARRSLLSGSCDNSKRDQPENDLRYGCADGQHHARPVLKQRRIRRLTETPHL